MKFDFLKKYYFISKKLNCFTSSIFIAIIFGFLLTFYCLDASSLSNFLNFDSLPTVNKLIHKSFSIKFDVDGKDVLVFLHIQKTGGTLLERSLTKDGLINFKCKCIKREKRCNCLNKLRLNWIFSRYSTGWKCGLHADWTELSYCVNKFLLTEAKKSGFPNINRKTYFFTVLREPGNRYLSEWKHVQRGATWRRSKHFCRGHSLTNDDLAPCYTDIDWSGVSLLQFMNCKTNLANNRQTRMLADLSEIGCYNESWPNRNQIMLESAKNNIAEMSFFGLLEFIPMTQYMFHRTFSLKFIELLIPLNVTHSRLTQVSNDVKEKILKINHLDVDLYQFAKQLFFKRLINNLILDRNIIELCCHHLSKKINWKHLFNEEIVYVEKKSDVIDDIIMQLLLLDGSRPPSQSVMEQRKLKWKNKILNDMQSDIDNDYQ